MKKATVLPSKNLFKAMFKDIIDLPEPLRPPSKTSSCVAKPPFIASNSALRPDGNILKSSSEGKKSNSPMSYNSSLYGIA